MNPPAYTHTHTCHRLPGASSTIAQLGGFGIDLRSSHDVAATRTQCEQLA